MLDWLFGKKAKPSGPLLGPQSVQQETKPTPGTEGLFARLPTETRQILTPVNARLDAMVLTPSPGRLEAVQAELAKAIGKSRRIVGKYIEELQSKEVCTVRSGKNQHARTCFEIRDNYWPYRRTEEAERADAQVRNSYVEAVRNRFVTIGCTVGSFSSRDAQLAQDFQRRGIPLETVQGALLMGAVRKYVSWLNGGLPQPIGSLAYFSALVMEIQERPLPGGYDEYLQRKVVQLARAWERQSSAKPRKGGCLTIDETKTVQ